MCRQHRECHVSASRCVRTVRWVAVRCTQTSEPVSCVMPTADNTSQAGPSSMAAFFPETPIGAGLDKGLAYVDRFVAFSAQSLVSLSPFIIPVVIAISWKIGQWFGLAAPLLLVLPVAGILINAEHVLQDRHLLPFPNHKLKAASKGKYVCHHSLWCMRMPRATACLTSSSKCQSLVMW